MMVLLRGGFFWVKFLDLEAFDVCPSIDFCRFQMRRAELPMSIEFVKKGCWLTWLHIMTGWHLTVIPEVRFCS